MFDDHHVSASPVRKERIYLTGFMGSGKSTIGPILANTIGYEFVDVDRTIEERAGLSVTAIFKEKGEMFFRALEQKVINELSARSHIVISLGGGTITEPSVFRTVTTTGIIVYLKAAPNELFKRLRNKMDRPVLMDGEGNRFKTDDLRERIQNLYVARQPLYENADITVVTEDQPVGKTVDLIVKKLAPYLNEHQGRSHLKP
jgi:shikimate kinase